MNSQKKQQAIPIEVLRKVNFKQVDCELPIYADNQSILKKLEPKLKFPNKELNERQLYCWNNFKKEYEDAKEEVLSGDGFYKLKSFISKYFKRYFRILDIQDMMRIHKSSVVSMGTFWNSIEEKLRPAWIFRKIELSSWHWGKYKNGSYNEISNAYNCLSSFNIPLKDFSIEVDTSSSLYNKKGYSKYTRTYLDAELAYLIKYKGKHVITLGFNITLEGEKKVQIRQIQCVNHKGNRWMYKLPKNYIEYFVDRFFEAFEGYEIYLIKSKSVIEEISSAYIYSIERELNYLKGSSSKEKHNQEMSVNHALYNLFNFDLKDAPRMKSIYSRRMKGYRRIGFDKTKSLNLLHKK